MAMLRVCMLTHYTLHLTNRHDRQVIVLKEQAVIRNEVESAIRTLEANRLAVNSRRTSLAAVEAEVAYQEDRWLSLAGDPRLGQLQLDDLLNAHVRLLQEEQTLLAALIEFNVALIEVQRATGNLVRFANTQSNTAGLTNVQR